MENRCNDRAPDGYRLCMLQAGHPGNHGHAEGGTADWWVWTPDGVWSHHFDKGRSFYLVEG